MQGSCFKVTLNIRYLSMLKCMPQVFAQMASLLKPSCATAADLMSLYKMQSSANRQHNDDKL